jgi:hypothetical protein
MHTLKGDILERFMEGDHVQRHKQGILNGMWTDMFIETTCMHYGHEPRGLTGLTMNQTAVDCWALSLQTCIRKYYKDDHRHKEEMPSRVVQDRKDRQALHEKLKLCINPLMPEAHPLQLVNIVTGRINPKTVKVDDALAIGTLQRKEFESSWPEGVMLRHRVVFLCT